MKKILSLLIILLLFSCSPQKRINRIFKNHPELKTTEVYNFRDTFYIPLLQTDSVFSVKFDTVTIDNERIFVQVIKKDSLIYLHSVAKADTIFINKNIEIETVKVATGSCRNFWKYATFVLIGCSLILFLIVILKR